MPRRSLRSRLLALAALMSAPLSALEIVAHRGASYDAPENTLAAQRLAWEQGADAVETDIHLTKDGKIVALHDRTMKRTTGTEGAVAQLTLAELRRLDAGSWKHAKFAGEKLPTLDEQLAAIPAGKKLLVEIKVGPEIVPELQRAFARAGVAERNLTIISFNADALREVRRVLPRYRTLYLLGYKAPDPKAKNAKRQPTIDEAIREAKAAGFSGLDLQHTWPVTAAEVKRVRDAGLELHVWTVDDVAIARRWIDLGVASLTTNRPGWLREQLQR